MPRHLWQATDKQRQTVIMAKAAGLTHQQIADLIGIDEKTLVKHLGDELKSAHAKAITAVANNLYKRAVSEEKEAVPAAIFWLKTRAKWREADEPTADDRSITINIVKPDGAD